MTEKAMDSKRRVAGLKWHITNALEYVQKMEPGVTIEEVVLALLQSAERWQTESVAIDNREDQ